jgi:5-formyltetrahydrofolate cyclo-ligase
MNKDEIREKLKIQRKNFHNTPEYKIYSDQASNNLKSLLCNMSPDLSGIIGCYFPIDSELDIKSLFPHLKQIAFSRVDIRSPDSPIEFIDVGQFDLEKNYSPNSEYLIESKSICVPLIITVPAIALDQNFNRIGYGKGHFDKFLDKVSEIGYKPYKIGVCFDFQLLKAVPHEPHDVQMDAIVTETKILRRI